MVIVILALKKLARCDLCILRPELCHYHKGTCREPSWGENNCLSPHIVYLANTSGVKVGITRETQIPTRWMIKEQYRLYQLSRQNHVIR